MLCIISVSLVCLDYSAMYLASQAVSSDAFYRGVRLVARHGCMRVR